MIVGNHFCQNCDIVEKAIILFLFVGSFSGGWHTCSSLYLPCATITAPLVLSSISLVSQQHSRECTSTEKRSILSNDKEIGAAWKKWCNILHCHKWSGLCILCQLLEKWRGQKISAVMDRASAATLPPYCWWSNVHHKSSEGKGWMWETLE